MFGSGVLDVVVYSWRSRSVGHVPVLWHWLFGSSGLIALVWCWWFGCGGEVLVVGIAVGLR